MRKLRAALAVVGLAVIALSLASCGGGSGGKEGGTLTGSYASFPDYLDPTISYTAEGWTAMYSTYLPLLTYAHASGAAGSKVVPALAESLPKVTDGGKTYTLTLRKGLKYSDGTPVRASDFTEHGRTPLQAQLARLALLLGHRRRGTVRQDQDRRHLRDQDRRQDGQDHDRADPAARHLHQRARPALRRAGASPTRPTSPRARIRRRPPGPTRSSSPNPAAAGPTPATPQWAKSNGKLMPDLPAGHVDKVEIKVVRNGATQVNEIERNKTNWMQTIVPADLYSKVKDQLRGHPVPGRASDQPLLLLDEHDEGALRRRQSAPGGQLRGRLRGAGTDLRRLARRRSPDPARRHAGTRNVRSLPEQHDQSQGAFQRSQPLRPRHHRLDRQRKPQQRSRRLLPRRAHQARLQRQAENDQRRQLHPGDRQRNDARPRRRLVQLVRRLPAPERASSNRSWRAKASPRPATTTSPA